MSKITEYILEKVSKSEINDALKNPNVRIGCEVEFYIEKEAITEYYFDSYDYSESTPYDDLLIIAESYMEKFQTFKEEWTQWFESDKNDEEEPEVPEIPVELRRYSTTDDDGYVIPDMDHITNMINDWMPEIDEDALRECFVEKIAKGGYDLPDEWEYGTDGSLTETHGPDIEISTTPMTIKEFMDIVPKMFEMVERWGVVTDRCGFHVSISLTNVDDLEKELDVVKLVLFTDEEYIYNFFDSRRENAFAKEMKKMVISDRTIGVDTIKKLVDEKKLKSNYYNSHFNAINQEHLSTDNKYIEFRYLGGENYHKKWNIIKTIIGQYIHNLVLSCDPTFKYKEYILKIQRIINKIDNAAKIIYLEKINHALEQYPELADEKEILKKEKKKVTQLLKNTGKEFVSTNNAEEYKATILADIWWRDLNDVIRDLKTNESKKLVLEKVSKREVDEALDNPNVRIGVEFEFIIPSFDKKYGEPAKMWVEWDRYNLRFEAWQSSTEEYRNAGEEEGHDPPDVPEWAAKLGYEPGEEDLPNPTELFELPEMDVEKFFKLVVKEFLPLDKLPFTNYVVEYDKDIKHVTKWGLYSDATLGPSGIEVVSPIMNMKEFMDICPKMFDFIEKHGATDDSCGLHISISLKNVPNLSKTLDVVKMALFLDEEYIYNFFKKRRDNDYARSAHKAVRIGTSKSEIEDFIKDNIDVVKLRKAIPNTHYEAINIEHLDSSPEKQYIEFRYIGSGDYHKKWNEIKKIVAHYIWALSIGNDPEFKKKEYMLKLNRLMLKHDLFTKLKRLDIMDKEKKQDTPEYNVISKQVKQLTGMGIKINKNEFDVPIRDDMEEE